MTRQRRQRLLAVIRPLVSLNGFSSSEAKQVCSGAHPGYVTRTLNQLVRDGLLRVSRNDDQFVFYWQWYQPPVVATGQWIERQLDSAENDRRPGRQSPRQRLIRCGAESLGDADLLSLLIRVAVAGPAAAEAAQQMAHRFSTRWHELPQCGLADLRAIAPVTTPAVYAQIMAAIELGRRVAMSQRPYAAATGITSTGRAIEFCHHTFRRLAMDGVQEEFHLVTLDTKHKPIGTHRVTVGTLDASLVHPREVFRPAIRHAAAAVLLVHNHPSGDPHPSREDRLVTDQLTQAGKLLGIQVLDHIIVAREGCVSVRECQA